MAANPDAPTSSAHQLSCSSQCLDFSSFPPHILHLDMHHLLPEWPLKLPHQLRVFGPHPLPSAAMSNPFPPPLAEKYMELDSVLKSPECLLARLPLCSGVLSSPTLPQGRDAISQPYALYSPCPYFFYQLIWLEDSFLGPQLSAQPL